MPDDKALIAMFSNGTVDLEQLSDVELKRVLWLAASGQMFLSQAIGNDIDQELRDRPIRALNERMKFLGEVCL